MVRISKTPLPKNPTSSTPEDDNASRYNSYHSGQVQYSVAGEKTLLQTNYLGTEAEHVKMAPEAVNHTTVVTDSLNIMHTGDGVKHELTQLAQHHTQTYQAEQSINETVEQHSQTISAKSLQKTITAGHSEVNTNTFTQTTSGSDDYTANNISIEAVNATLIGGSGTVQGQTIGGGGQQGTIKGGVMNIHAPQMTKLKAKSKITVKGGEASSSLHTHTARSVYSDQVYKPNELDQTYLVHDVVYVAQDQALYFLNPQESQIILNSEEPLLSAANQLQDIMTEALSEPTLANTQLSRAIQKLDSILKSGNATSSQPQLKLAIHLTKSRIVLVSAKALSQVQLSLPVSKINLQKGLLNWDQLKGTLEGKLKKPYDDILIEDTEAADSATKALIDVMGGQPSDQTAWLDLGNDPRQNTLLTALNLTDQIHFSDLSHYIARLPTDPQVAIPVELSQPFVQITQPYLIKEDKTRGIFTAKMTQVAYDSEPLLENILFLKQDESSKQFQVLSQNSMYTAWHNQDPKNHIQSALIHWRMQPHVQHPGNSLDLPIGQYQSTHDYPTRNSSSSSIPYSVQYDEQSKGWLIFSQTKGFFAVAAKGTSGLKGSQTQQQLESGYPESAYLPLTPHYAHYNFATFMYYQLVHFEYQWPEDVISKNDQQVLERFYLSRVLFDQYLNDQQNDKQLKGLMSNGFTNYVENILDKVEQASNTLLASLPPSVIGKLIYLINTVDMTTYSEADQAPLNTRRMQSMLRLLTWLPSRKAYLIMLQNYQAPLETNQVSAKDSIDAIWHSEGQPLYFSAMHKAENFNRLQSAYQFLNGDIMGLPKKTDPFVMHNNTVFPQATAFLRNAANIEKQLEDGEVVLEKGFPTVTYDLNVSELTLPPKLWNGYVVTGTASLDGQVSVTDKSSKMTEVELHSNGKETEISLNLKEKISEWMGSLNLEIIKKNDDQLDVMPSWNSGSADVNCSFALTADGDKFLSAGHALINNSSIIKTYSINNQLSITLSLQGIKKDKPDLSSELSYSLKANDMQIASAILMGLTLVGAAILGL